jgi:hypothetical protein
VKAGKVRRSTIAARRRANELGVLNSSFRKRRTWIYIEAMEPGSTVEDEEGSK